MTPPNVNYQRRLLCVTVKVIVVVVLVEDAAVNPRDVLAPAIKWKCVVAIHLVAANQKDAVAAAREIKVNRAAIMQQNSLNLQIKHGWKC